MLVKGNNCPGWVRWCQPHILGVKVVNQRCCMESISFAPLGSEYPRPSHWKSPPEIVQDGGTQMQDRRKQALSPLQKKQLNMHAGGTYATALSSAGGAQFRSVCYWDHGIPRLKVQATGMERF